jgi:hypothetical protein
MMAGREFDYKQKSEIPPSCDVRRSLGANFATAARLYAEAVVLLTHYGVADPQKYERMRKAVKEAQEKAQQAAVQFEEHIDFHQCHG